MDFRSRLSRAATRLGAGSLALFLSISIVLPALAGAVGPSAAPVADGTRSSQVVLILAPYLTWSDISAQTTPRLWEGARQGLVANINARNRAGAGESMMTERGLSIGSGAPAVGDPGALDAFDRDESFLGNRVETITPAYLQAPLGENAIAYLGLPRTRKANTANSFNTTVGLLGSTISDGGGVSAAIGNSDLRGGKTNGSFERPAALVAMDQDGFVRFGDVSERLLSAEVSAPFALRSDPAKMKSAMEDARRDIETSDARKSLVVVDPGDLYRAQQAAVNVDPAVAVDQWKAALAGLDACYASAREVWPRSTIIISSIATRDAAGDVDCFGPLIITGPRVQPGTLISASTHRAGLVTDFDLAPSILAMLDIAAPIQMGGAALTASAGSGTLAGRVSTLKRANSTAASVEAVRLPVINAFVVVTVLIIVLGALFVFLADRILSPRTCRVLKRLMYAAILFVLCLPVANWLMFFIYRWPQTPSGVLTQYLATATALWVISLLVAWKGNRRLPLIALCALTALVIIVDQFLGAPASFASIFGYSPIAAARYYGMGNEAAGILVGAVMVGAALLIDQYPQARWMGAFKRYGIIAAGLVTMIAAAAPVLGANAGVAIWATLGFIVFWLLINAKRFSVKTVAVMVAAVVVVVGAFVLVDLFAPGEGTHLGKLVLDMAQGGFGPFWTVATRKLVTNIRVFAYTNWAYIFVAVVAYLIVVSFRPTGDFAVMLGKNRAFHKALISVLITGIIAFCTEDSGIVLPSLMVIYLGTSIVWLMLEPLKGATREERSALRRAHLQREIEVLESAGGDPGGP